MSRRRYTEAQFRAAVDDPSTKTIADLCRALGLLPKGGNYETVLDFADERGISLANLQRPTARHVDDTSFLQAVERACSYPELCRLLGLQPRQHTYRRLRARARLLGRQLPADWSRPGPRPTGRKRSARPLPEADVRRAALGNFSIAAVLRELGLSVTADAYARFAASVESYGIDTSHFGHPGRMIRQDVAALAPLLDCAPLPPYAALGPRLIQVGLKRRACEQCGTTRWQGAEVPLELDHINGDRHDNRLSNLRLLCPNCHALTPTFRARNRGARARRRATPPVPGTHPLPRPASQLRLL